MGVGAADMTQAISTREGWSAFVSESLDKPLPITRAELDALSPADRAMNREARPSARVVSD